MYLSSSSNTRKHVSLLMLLCLVGCDSDSVTVDTAALPNTSNSSSVIEQAISTLGQPPFSSTFNDTRLTEVSGMQRSFFIDGIYYVHNDSDSAPLIYASDASGKILGSMFINNANSTDWEALAGAQQRGTNRLIIADIGNNAGQRQDLQLWVIDEPILGELEAGFELELVADNIALNYSDGLSYDAEGLYIDRDNDTLVILTKNSQDTANQSIWKGSLSGGLTDGSLSLQFSGVVNLSSEIFVNAITDVDIHPNGREIAVLTYGPFPGVGSIHIWTSTDSEGTSDALLRPANETLSVPIIGSNLQAESISYSADGSNLLVGAEGLSRSTLTVVAR